MFKIDVLKMYWITDGDDSNDLCAHGDMVAVIGSEKIEYSGTVSSTAIYLLKTLTENHSFGQDNQMMPCCGHFIIANKELDTVQIMGCPNGVDWEVTHIGDSIKLKTEKGNEVFVDFEDYKEEVFCFADKIESFYKSCSEKKLPDDKYDRAGYIAFWNEWNRRRYGQ